MSEATIFGTREPDGVGIRVVITDLTLHPSEVAGAVGRISSVHAAGCMMVQLEEPVLGYHFVHAARDQVTVSPYQGEPLVAVNNHD